MVLALKSEATTVEKFFASLPYWLVFPLLAILIGGFVAWG